ncbi:MAG: DUF5320 domain-containing protein [Synergistetes bacterium]|nr:MAG: Uncharacterized protein XD52_0100 [bacterium 42_11]MBC7331205.1 DUF5320 domain-containing protein [Synergistota bacterium]MDK2871502.1 hypothetical protein [bacterium]
MWGWGRGFRFRGSVPPWPYIGWGRGGLPRCWYYWGPSYTREEELALLKEQADLLRGELELIEERVKKLEQGKGA